MEINFTLPSHFPLNTLGAALVIELNASAIARVKAPPPNEFATKLVITLIKSLKANCKTKSPPTYAFYTILSHIEAKHAARINKR